MQQPPVDLLCLPWAGGSATVYLRWQHRLPRWIRVVPVELPGRAGRLAEPFAEDFARLALQLCDEHAQSMQGRYALFGHSMGALLAHAIARQQYAHRCALPCALFASGSPAPSRLKPRITDKGDAALIAELRSKGGTPEEVFCNDELLRIAIDTLRADYRVYESFEYRPSEPLPFPFHVFSGSRDQITTDQLDAWRIEVRGLFTLDWFGGGHFFIRQEEQRVLSAIIRELTRQSRAALATV